MRICWSFWCLNFCCLLIKCLLEKISIAILLKLTLIHMKLCTPTCPQWGKMKIYWNYLFNFRQFSHLKIVLPKKENHIMMILNKKYDYILLIYLIKEFLHNLLRKKKNVGKSPKRFAGRKPSCSTVYATIHDIWKNLMTGLLQFCIISAVLELYHKICYNLF